MKQILNYQGKHDLPLNEHIISILNDHLQRHNATGYEVYEQFVLCSFNWYNIKNKNSEVSRISIYLDRDNIYIFIEDVTLLKSIEVMLSKNIHKDNYEILRLFFIQLINDDMIYLDSFEEQIIDAENEAIKDEKEDYLDKIIEFRKHLLNLKHYYNQLQIIFDGFLENEKNYFDEEALRKLTIVHNRIDRLQLSVLNLRDYVTQMREAYQAQIDIEQNNLMRIFTVITAIFLPLTLMVGWYGMNFKNMYELDNDYGYPAFIVISILVCVTLLLYFKKRKWF